MWAIEVSTKYGGIDSCDLAYAVYRSFLKYLDLLPSYPSHRCFECENGQNIGINRVIELVDADLSRIQCLSGRWRRVAKAILLPGKMASATVQVEIYPLGQPPVKVSFDQPKRNGAANCLSEQPGILLIGRTQTDELRTYCRSKDVPQVKTVVTDILSSRTHTDHPIVNWVERPPHDKPLPWLEGDFDVLIQARLHSISFEKYQAENQIEV